ncbi:uroporphyrinogen-III synthase [Brumimicrobium aurantiacum]|uniref:Uroporphyrinogen-III synthase n=1 Tax=Brumimicrobium aurantiacum TaxID=1737063 RepID=A0A3E1F218_9FLAO|nr:uroporphyrinogen-III synthase [Brumimicrobium aurantiacum]RFC55803.1 hypothetical protein DXU93_02380 [Brumimicrobium aurantiacum]
MLFVSKKVNDPSFLDYIQSKAIRLCDIPMISFAHVPFELPETNFEIIFFTSPRSVAYFLAQYRIPKDVVIATIGDSTTQHLTDKGYTVQFTGKTSGEPEIVSASFKSFVGDRTVLFPQSNFSHRSMQKNLNQSQIIDLVIYETQYTPIQLKENPSILVFTSPTNLRSFLKKNTVYPHQKIIAWGKTTASAILAEGMQADYTMKYSNFEELKEILMTMNLPNHK